MELTVTRPVEDCGTVVIFEGYQTAEDRLVTFGVDHRLAQGLIDGLASGEDVEVVVEGFQILHVGAPGAVI
jgi:hypothetical protein